MTVEQRCVDNQVATDGGGSPPAGIVTDICTPPTTTTTTSTTTTTTTLVCCNVFVSTNQAGCFESTTGCTGATAGGAGTLCDDGACGATRVVADTCCAHSGGCFEYPASNAFGVSLCAAESGTSTTGAACDPSTGLCM